MSQYPSLFGVSRIPQFGIYLFLSYLNKNLILEKDRLHLNLKSRHFLVIHNGLFYTVNLFNKDGLF